VFFNFIFSKYKYQRHRHSMTYRKFCHYIVFEGEGIANFIDNLNIHDMV